MEEPIGRENRNHGKHTFHVPNFFARVSRPSRNQSRYRTIPGGEDEEGEEDGDARREDDQDSLTGVGVEASQEWQSLSISQHTLVRIAFGVFGAAVLLPFNALITPSEYYRSLLVGTPKENSFMSWITAVFCVSSIVFGAHATVSMQKASIGRRFILSTATITIVLLTTTILVAIDKPSSSGGASSAIFPLLLSLSLLLAAATSYLQLAVVTLANAYGPSCMGTMLAGQGVVGASVSLVQLITAVSASARSKSTVVSNSDKIDEARKAAYQFFGANTAFMVAGLVLFLVLQRTTLYSEMKMKMDNAKSTLTEVLAQDYVRQQQANEDEEGSNDHIPSVSGIKRYMNLQTQQQYSRVSATQKKVVLACLSIAYVFVVTLALFPALTAKVQSVNHSRSTIVFVALHFFLFNVGDLLGRSLPSLSPRLFLLRKMKVVAFLCLLRTAFVPLLAYCNITTPSSSSPSVLSTALFGDVTFFILMILLGISNGLLATTIFVIGPHQDNLTEPNDQNLAAGLLSWWLTFGLAIGSLSSFIVAASV